MTFASAEPWAVDSACSSCAVRVVAYPARAVAAAKTRRRRRRCCQVLPARPGSVWQSALTVAMGPTCQRLEMRPYSLRARSFLFCGWPRARPEQLQGRLRVSFDRHKPTRRNDGVKTHGRTATSPPARAESDEVSLPSSLLHTRAERLLGTNEDLVEREVHAPLTNV